MTDTQHTPEPVVDPDLLAVREIVAVAYESSAVFATAVRRGREDNRGAVRAALTAYKAGQEQERGRAEVLVNFAVEMEENDDNEVCDAAWEALDVYWGQP